MRFIIILLFTQLTLLVFSQESENKLQCERKLSTANIESAGEFLIELKITAPEDITGVVQLNEALPSGYIAEIVDNHGALFSFENGTAKFTWISFPKEKTFTVTYRVKSSEMLSVPEAIEGKVAYKRKREDNKQIASEQNF